MAFVAVGHREARGVVDLVDAARGVVFGGVGIDIVEDVVRVGGGLQVLLETLPRKSPGWPPLQPLRLLEQALYDSVVIVIALLCVCLIFAPSNLGQLTTQLL